MTGKTFQRTKEDFVCEHCGTSVIGDGYTNHCPNCLWSKHVDVNPGDRAQSCGGLMEPVRIEGSTPAYEIVHKCLRCDKEHKNRADLKDNLDAIINLAGRTF